MLYYQLIYQLIYLFILDFTKPSSSVLHDRDRAEPDRHTGLSTGNFPLLISNRFRKNKSDSKHQN